jgi:DNA-binding MarR family transcriptional regulator
MTMARNGLDRSPLHLLHRVDQFAADIFAAEIPDITPRQLAVLLTVAAGEGANQQYLVDTTGVDRSTLGLIVRRLLRKGLLQRRRSSEDRRAYAVKLTDAGRRLLGVAGPAARRVDERVVGALSDKQRELLMVGLTSIVEAMNTRPPPA